MLGRNKNQSLKKCYSTNCMGVKSIIENPLLINSNYRSPQYKDDFWTTVENVATYSFFSQAEKSVYCQSLQPARYRSGCIPWVMPVLLISTVPSVGTPLGRHWLNICVLPSVGTAPAWYRFSVLAINKYRVTSSIGAALDQHRHSTHSFVCPH